MKWIYLLDSRREAGSVATLGGKGASLARLAQNGFNIPATACVSSTAYSEFVRTSGLREKISLELNRKKFSDMRWEEVWDASLRIRNYFLHVPFPEEIADSITSVIAEYFPGKLLAVRSSAPDEDAGKTSFAGLHESYLNIRGSRQVLEHVRKVWASLWSDRALLYRQELGLDVGSSSMAVVVQEMVSGESSGIVFSRHPDNKAQMIIEAVYGLNQGLVDGEVEPDRWILSRENGKTVSHVPPSTARQAVYDRHGGLRRETLAGDQASLPPLTEQNVVAVRQLALQLENFFVCPQDIEWTLQGGNLFLLQSRPVTSIAEGDQKDERAWYLSLHRSFDNLARLRKELEETHLPAMDVEAGRLSAISLEELSDSDLADEIEKRAAINEKWVSLYWSECIPFAHGARLFGEVYNDVMKPDDPFEFVSLLSGSSMLSTERNALIAELAGILSAHPEVCAGSGLHDINDPVFWGKWQGVQEQLALFFSGNDSPEAAEQTENIMLSLLCQYAQRPAAAPLPSRIGQIEKSFLHRVGTDLQLGFSGKEILELGRASYRLRDDDNIYLGRIERQLTRAVAEGRKRLGIRGEGAEDTGSIIKSLRGEKYSPSALQQKVEKKTAPVQTRIKARQLTGQPASKGIARGPCRLVESARDMMDFKQGEVLVVDAIDPNMTFVAPLASAIVERRGGMLIHGAIIAREYGIPCVTGVPDIMQLLQNGETVTVDGFLGIVTLGETFHDGE